MFFVFISMRGIAEIFGTLGHGTAAIPAFVIKLMNFIGNL